ncbi:protein NETWORKED 4A-like [Primulina eburnea]|uniref:protein NETWORKED 4A-like n=1 Tax=Primulina eburnea TaxID=1245227 RepID=UPI003C6C90A6
MKSSKIKSMESKKSHSWWWDSHVSPKNSKWLQENLEEMDQHVKRMLKLIEEDGDSFAKKAEMYYQKRPELIILVEELYRMYRSLAERYDNVTGELRKNIPLDLQSQGSGVSEAGSEPRLSRRKSGPRAAGFDFFLGSGGSGSDLYSKEGDESSTLDSEAESEDSSVNNYSSTQSNDDEQGLRRRIVELEVELREIKQKSQMQREERDQNSDFSAELVTSYEDLKAANEKIRRSGEEITHLKLELQKYECMSDSNNFLSEDDMKRKNPSVLDSVTEIEESTDRQKNEVLDQDNKIQTLEEGLRITEEKLHLAEEEVSNLRQELINKDGSIQNLQDQLKTASKDVSGWKTKLEKEKREVSKILDRIARYKNNLSDRDQEIRGLKEAMSNANKSLSEENDQLQAQITRILKERTYLEDNLKEMDLRCQFLEEDMRRVKFEKDELQVIFEAQIRQWKADITKKDAQLEELNRNLETLELENNTLMAEKDDLNSKVAALAEEIHSKEDYVDQIKNELNKLQMEHVELISGAEAARNTVKEISLKVEELETEVERQKGIILEGAERKREAIRQLCFSLEHYRSGYHELRMAVVGHKRLPVTVS